MGVGLDVGHVWYVHRLVRVSSAGALCLLVWPFQMESLLYEDQWCAVSLAVYRCMEVTVTETRGERKNEHDLQQGLAMLR